MEVNKVIHDFDLNNFDLKFVRENVNGLGVNIGKEPVSKGSKCSRCNKKGHDIKYCPRPILYEWSLVRDKSELIGGFEGLKREGKGLKREGKGLKKYLAALCESSDEDG